MTCSRCAGFMVKDHFFDLDSPGERLFAWRCVNCGHIVERGMSLNKLANHFRPMNLSEAQKTVIERPERARESAFAKGQKQVWQLDR